MVRINILCRQKKANITGGNIYDSYLFEQIEKEDNIEVRYITDEQIGCKILLFYSIYCWMSRKDILDCDKLIINSSRFSKFLPFLFFLRFQKKRLPVITIHHHFGFRQLQGIKKYVYRWMELQFLKYCDIIITPNQYVREELLSHFGSSKIAFLELAFNKVPNKKITPQFGNFLYVGTIEKRKGIKYLIESLALLSAEMKKEITVNIVGKVVEQAYYKSILKLINRLGLQNIVKFYGRLSDEELSTAYQNASYFVFPSLHEGYGMVIIEAMSYGIPVIAFDNSAMPYTIKNGYNGLLIKNKNIHELADRMQTVFIDKNLREKLSIGALETYNRARSLNDLDKDISLFIKQTLLC